MTTKQRLEWLGAITGLLGSGLIACRLDISGYGFVLFLVSNVFLVAYGLKTRAWGLVTMQLGYTATSLLGLYRWLA
jgi:nicotinamide riboside transporter PnuC